MSRAKMPWGDGPLPVRPCPPGSYLFDALTASRMLPVPAIYEEPDGLYDEHGRVYQPVDRETVQ